MAFEVLHKHGVNNARTALITTDHGSFTTPTFMPVGTMAFVNSISAQDLENANTQIILGGNTFHMLCSNRLEQIKKMNGMHKMMGWNKPMLTDSGGFQIFSFAQKKINKCKIYDGYAIIKDINGTNIILTPEISIQAQKIIGADIIMALDHCASDKTEKKDIIKAMDRTHAWAEICSEYHHKNTYSIYGNKQLFFCIVQGGDYEDLRKISLQKILELDPDGIAIGGETIGPDVEKTCEVIKWLVPEIPENKPRYTMGVGIDPQNVIDVVAAGADMFDCVAPTRNARHGSLYCGQIQLIGTNSGRWLKFVAQNDEISTKLSIKKSIYQFDNKPIMDACKCQTCLNHSRAYLHYLFKIKSNLYYQLACIHNIHVMNYTCATIVKLLSKEI